MQILQAYLESIKDIKESDNEHTYRTPLENLLNALKNELYKDNRTQLKGIKIYQEKSEVKKALGTPDFRVFSTDLMLGLVENKRVSKSDKTLQELIDKANKDENAQIARYLRLCNNLILTDYLRFWRVIKNDNGKIEVLQSQKFQICELNELENYAQVAKNALKATQQSTTNSTKATQNSSQATLFSTSQATIKVLKAKESELLALFKLFFSSKPKPINKLKEFTDALALRTYFLKQFLIKSQSNDLEFYQNNIQGLYDTFQKLLYKELKFEDFCDSFAQMLTYSLFIAKINKDSTDKITLDNVKNFISTSFPLIRALSGFLQVLNENHSTKWLITEILNIINHIDITSIIKELNSISEKDLFDYIHKDPFTHIYEPFLQQYDPDMKKARGVFYTPLYVVDFIINAVDFTLKSDFKCENGLGNALEKDSPITLLDFATGTGTFLLEAFRKALSSLSKSSIKRQDEISRLISRFYGFEFLIAPYTIAQLKIAQVLKEDFKAPLKDGTQLNIYLTNTLQSTAQDKLQASK